MFIVSGVMVYYQSIGVLFVNTMHLFSFRVFGLVFFFFAQNYILSAVEKERKCDYVVLCTMIQHKWIKYIQLIQCSAIHHYCSDCDCP